jgi:hypothetical protein
LPGQKTNSCKRTWAMYVCPFCLQRYRLF